MKWYHVMFHSRSRSLGLRCLCLLLLLLLCLLRVCCVSVLHRLASKVPNSIVDAVLQVCDDKEAMLSQAIELAVMIASKSPVSAHIFCGCCTV